MSRHFYRLDGSPYDNGLDGLYEWAMDLEDGPGRVVGQDRLWNGLFVSTVWLGIDYNFLDDGPPLIFETMVFPPPGLQIEELDVVRWATLEDAEVGHAAECHVMRSLGYTLRLFWSMIMDGYWMRDE